MFLKIQTFFRLEATKFQFVDYYMELLFSFGYNHNSMNSLWKRGQLAYLYS